MEFVLRNVNHKKRMLLKINIINFKPAPAMRYLLAHFLTLSFVSLKLIFC